jgi:hypothetical protein
MFADWCDQLLCPNDIQGPRPVQHNDGSFCAGCLWHCEDDWRDALRVLSGGLPRSTHLDDVEWCSASIRHAVRGLCECPSIATLPD